MCAYTRTFLFRRARIKRCPCISKTLAMKDLSCKQSRCPKRRGICIIVQAGLTANVCAFALYASRNATRHGRHKLCAAGVAPRHIDDPPLECCHAVPPLFSFPQHALGPPPDIFLRVQVRRMRGPLRQKTHTVALQSGIGLFSVHDCLAIQEDRDALPVRELSLQEGGPPPDHRRYWSNPWISGARAKGRPSSCRCWQ